MRQEQGPLPVSLLQSQAHRGRYSSTHAGLLGGCKGMKLAQKVGAAGLRMGAINSNNDRRARKE